MGKLVDFSHSYDFNMPVPDWPGIERQEFSLKTFNVKLNGLRQNYLSFNLHSGTHVDAPSHFDIDLPSIEKVEFQELMGEGIILPLEKGPLEPIDYSELSRFKSQIIGKKMVFVSTGWERKWGTKQYEQEYPFLTTSAGNFLVELGIKVLGLDTPGPDAPLRSPFREGSPLHKILLTRGCYIIENLCNLSEARGKMAFIYALPLKIQGATGSPVRVIARLEDGQLEE